MSLSLVSFFSSAFSASIILYHPFPFEQHLFFLFIWKAITSSSCPLMKRVCSSSCSLLKCTSSSCKQDGLWYTAIGGQLDCSGSAMMYSSSLGFLNWEYTGLLASQVGSDCTSECQPASDGQACNQIGAACRSWECPDFFTVPGLDGRYALKWSDQV